MKSRWFKYLLIFVGSVLLFLVGVYFIRFRPMMTLMETERKPENFRNMSAIFPSNSIAASDTPSPLPTSEQPFSFSMTWEGREQSLEEILASMSTTGFLVLRNDSILYENYFLGADQHSRLTSFSVSKSVTSTLVGIALHEGKIKDIHDPVDQYLPSLRGTGFEGVSIQHLLQMASGIQFSEKYEDPDSDINQMMFAQFAYYQPLKEWITGFGPKQKAGETFEYQSINTIVLCVMLSELYGKSLSSVLEEKIWKPMGAEQSAFWNTDEYGTEIALGFLNATLRDYARFGLLHLHEGTFNGQQIVNADWIAEATRIEPGESHPLKDSGDTGYQYHWWIPQGTEGEYMASGYMGQVVYVNPARRVVIVKTGTEEAEHLPLIQAIAREISPIAQPDTVSNRELEMSLAQ